MRKALIIVAVVAGYSLLETGVLLSVMLPHYGYSTRGTYEEVALLGQLLLIPGLAALLSRIMYGPYRFGRRAATVLLVGSLGVPIVLTLILIPIGLLVWAFSVSKIIFAVLLPVIVGSIALSLRFVIRKGANGSVQVESRRWLNERESGIDPRERKWRSRGIRLASGVPLLIVLLVFLFLPEIWGILSHVNQAQSANLPGYRVPIPATWIVLFHGNQPEGGGSWVNGIAGRGIAFGVRPYLKMRVPLSSWDIRTQPLRDTEAPKDDDVIARRVFAIGGESITCLDYRSSSLVRPVHVETSIAYVECSGTGRLRASFFGERNQVARFYRMLEGITPAQ